MDRKFQVTVNEHQLKLIADCLEDICRFMSGQMELWHATSNLNTYSQLSDKLEELKPLITPELELVDVINGTKQHQFKYKFYREGIEIYSENPIFKEEPVLLIRGWGYLTGFGGLHLSQEEAIKIQDEFGDYIVEQLNKGTI